MRAKLSELGLERVPSRSTVSKVMREHFGLHFGRFNAAQIRMHEDKFNEQRRHMARSIGQFLARDCIVVSVDESSFSTEQYRSQQWKPALRSEVRY